jgi:hypothetical protein
MSGRNQTPAETSSGLFGIKHSNRNTTNPKKDHWGKNRFNSSFPTALACYMIEQNIPAIYNKLILEGDYLRVDTSEISLREVFNCNDYSFDELVFDFESRYDPYQRYAVDQIDGVDLVVKHVDGTFLSPIEVKLTVIPDNTTHNRPESDWGCELVVRSGTTSYCALGMFDSVHNEAETVRNIFEDACSGIEAWTNNFEMSRKTAGLAECINAFQKRHLDKQKPLVMQPIWKTEGQSPVLAENAFDIVIWSDYAFSRLFIDRVLTEATTMSRDMRATARLARCIWELSKSGRTRLSEIYRVMTFDVQNDKEFAISGTGWRNYVSSERIIRPIMQKDVIERIIEPGFLENLRPERRFDQTLYFTLRR